MSLHSVLLESIYLETRDDDLAQSVRSARKNLAYRLSCNMLASQIVEVPPSSNENTNIAGFHVHGVIIQEVEEEPKAVLFQRAPGELFAGCWWTIGGSLPSFRSVPSYLLWKVHHQCGLTDLEIEVFFQKNSLENTLTNFSGIHVVPNAIGMFRIGDPSSDTFVSTSIVIADPYVNLNSSQHAQIKWFSLSDLMKSKNSCGHPYPQWAATKALTAYSTANVKALRQPMN